MSSQVNVRCAYCRKIGAPTQCSGCHKIRYCDPKCQKADWKSRHKKLCSTSLTLHSNTTDALVANPVPQTSHESDAVDDDYLPYFEDIPLDPKDPFWLESWRSPILLEIGILDILLSPVSLPGDVPTMTSNDLMQNFLMNPQTGEIPARWKDVRGPVTVARVDGKPLKPELLNSLCKYMKHLSDVFAVDENMGQGQIEENALKRFLKGTDGL